MSCLDDTQWLPVGWLPVCPLGRYFKWGKELWTLPLVLALLRTAGFSPGFPEGMGFETTCLPFSQMVQPLNKSLFPSSPASASRVCLLLVVGSRTPLWFGDIMVARKTRPRASSIKMYQASLSSKRLGSLTWRYPESGTQGHSVKGNSYPLITGAGKVMLHRSRSPYP